MSPASWRSRRITSDVAWAASGQIASIAGRLVGLKILTTVLAPEIFGEVTLLLGIGALVSGVFFQPIGQAVLRFYPDAVGARRLGALRALGARFMGRGGAGAAIALAAVAVWAVVSGTTAALSGVAVLTALTAADAWRTYEGNLLSAARRQRIYAAWNVADAWVRATLPLVVIRLAGPSASAAIAGQLAACVLVGIAFRRAFVLPAAGGAVDPEDQTWERVHRISFVRFILPLMPFALLGWVVGQADRYVLAEFAGIGAAGLYGAVYGLASQPFIAAGSIGVLAFRPVLFEAASRGDHAKERRVLAAWLAFVAATAVVGVAFVGAFSPWIVRIATGPSFWSGATLMPWIAAAYGLQGAQFAFESVLYAHRRTTHLLALQILGATASMGLYLGLVPRMGALGAAVGTLAGMSVTLVASLVLALRQRGSAGVPPAASTRA